MTLAIKTTEVSAVLLADGWHEILPQTFTVQRLAFTDSEGNGHRKAAIKWGYQFVEQRGSFAAPETVVVSGPLKAILAVRSAAESQPKVPVQAAEPPPSVPVRMAEVLPSVPVRVTAEMQPSVPVRVADVQPSVPVRVAEVQPSVPERAIGFEPSVPKRVADVRPSVLERPAEAPASVPERPTHFQQSILVRDEMERDRLARAGQRPLLGAPRPSLETRVADGNDDAA